jgi:peptidoglycan/LPS O-acetylase OafA/YrhL
VKTNNLNFLRLIAAGLVLYGHSAILLGHPEPLFLSWMPLGPLGVAIFFVISGYLVTQSWQQDPNLQRFFIRRCFRIFPGLIVCVLLCIFVLGPWLFGLSTNDVLTRMTATGDYSHGVYIYAFPLQQAIVFLYPNLSFGIYVALCSAVTLMLAIFSWHLVEKAALAFKPRSPALAGAIV